MDQTVGDALYLYTICSILPDSSDLLLYKKSLFLWLCIEPPRHAWRRLAIQHVSILLLFDISSCFGVHFINALAAVEAVQIHSQKS
jgi:hypothetical protein